MTPEAVEKFTVKVLEQAGVEIPEAFAHLRTEKPPTPDQAPHAKPATPVAAKKEAAPEARVVKSAAPRMAAKLPEPIATLAEAIPVMPVAPEVTEAIRAILEPDELPTPPKRTPKPAHARKTHVTQQEIAVEPIEFVLPAPIEAAVNGEPVIPKPPAYEAPAVITLEAPEAKMAETDEAGIAGTGTATVEAPEPGIALPFEVAPEAEAAPLEQTEAATAATAETNDLETTYDTFQNALFALAEALAPAAPTAEASTGEEAEAAPPICKEVAERLVALEPTEKADVMPIVQEISAAVREVHELTTTHASPEEIAAAAERLTELCVELFKALGIEYDEETVQQFVQSILRPDFVQNIAAAPVLDLEHMGTHEVKRRAGQLPTSLSDFLAGSSIHSLLGNLTLTLNRVYVNIT